MQHLQPNTTLQGGKYRIERVLGQGGFGITYLAIQVSSNRQVAIKELFIGGSGQAINDRRGNQVVVTNSANQASFNQQKEKFKKEALRLANLNHPNLVKVHEFFEENGTAYYVMDYIEGESLRTKLNREGVLSENLVLKYLQQLLLALEAAHKQSIWHLDIKPENIMVDKYGHVYLIDFGASKHVEPNSTLTTSLALAYTPGYCPPELLDLSNETPEYYLQAIKDIGPWTDIYALGATMYNLLTDSIPPSKRRLEKEGRYAFSFPSSISSKTQDLIVQMMKVNRNERPQKCKNLKIQYNVLSTKANKKRNVVKKSKSKKSKDCSEDTIVDIKEVLSIESLKTKYSAESYKNILRHRPSLLLAAEKGDPSSQYKVGKWFESHKGLDADRNNNYSLLAAFWYKKAAAQNYVGAQYMLGWCYENGFGVTKRDKTAIAWYRKAANNGSASAQNRLAKCYLKFELGRSRDIHEAIKWILKAGNLAESEILYTIGEYYESGTSVPCDKEKALEWFKRADKQGNSKARKKIAGELKTPADRGRPYDASPEYYYIEGNSKSYTRQEIDSLNLLSGSKLRKMLDKEWHPMEYFGFKGRKKGILEFINDIFS